MPPSALQEGRKRNGKGQDDFFLGAFDFFWGREGPRKDFLLQLIVSYGHVLLPGCWEFQSQFPSLSSGGSIGEGGWEWLLGELISRNTEKTQLTSHLLVLPNYQLNGHDLPLLRTSFMVPSAFCMLVSLIFQVPVNAFPWGRNSVMNESRYLFLSSFSYSVYFLHDA